MPAVVTITVQTTTGYNFFSFYRDIAGASDASNTTASGLTITNPSTTNYPGGLSFVVTSQTNDFTYDPNTHQPLTGTINSIVIRDSANNLLVTETGFSIPVTDMISAINLFNSNGSDASGLNAIFDQYSYTDTVDGGVTGASDFLSAANADSFTGSSTGGDWVSYQNAAGPVTADLADSSQNAGAAAGDTYTSIENLRGSNLNDTLIGTSGNNFLRGGLGADWLQGGGGTDTADYKGAAAGVIADLTTPSNNTNEAAGDTYTGISNLRGTDFNDVLKGSLGVNRLTGGLGADRFVYSGGTDTVADFDQGPGTSVFNHAEGDTVDLGNSQIYNWTELQSHLSASGGPNTVITIGANTVTLTGVNSANLTASDFFFTPTPLLQVSIGGGALASGGLPVNGGGAFSQFVAFGDSTIDSGYFLNTPISNNAAVQADYDAAKAAGGGIPTTLGGAMASTLLAQNYGLSAIPSNTPGGGTNYAASGATITGGLSGSLAPSVVSQVSTYLTTTGNVADPNALYLISAGGNSAKIAANLDPVAAVNYMISEADSMAAKIEQLHTDGAQYFVINFFSGSKALGVPYANELIKDLTNAGVAFIAADESALVNVINANPAPYGITNLIKPPSGPYSPGNPYTPAEGGATINPNPSVESSAWARVATTNVSADANSTYLWADNEHFAGAGQQAEANYIYSLVQNAIPHVGQTLSATATLFNITGTVTYQWQRFDGAIWSDIGGATNANYTVQLADAGDELRVEAFKSYDSGNASVSAFSAPTFDVSNSGIPVVTVTVVTPDGVDLHDLYGDIAGAEGDAPGATHGTTYYDAINQSTGHTFHLVGTGFTYDIDGHLTGGTVNELDILNSSDSSILVTETGFAIDAVALSNAIEALRNSGNSAPLTAIFNQYSYAVHGGAGNDVIPGFANFDSFDGGGGLNTVDYTHYPSGITGNLADPSQNTGNAAGDTYTNVSGLIGTGFNDTLIGDANDNTLRGGAGVDILHGGDGNDTLIINIADIAAGEVYDGGLGTDTLLVSGNGFGPPQFLDLGGIVNTGGFFPNFGVTLNSIEALTFASGSFGFTQVFLAASQLGSGLSSTLVVTGDSAVQGDNIQIDLPSAGTIDISGWTFANWQSRDHIYLDGSAGDDTITGSTQSDEITGGAGLDAIHAGDGNDFIDIDVSNGPVPGETYDGGSGTDTIFVYGGGASLNLADFSTSSLNSIEQLGFSMAGTGFLMFDTSQVGSGLSSTLAVAGDSNQNFVDLMMSAPGSVDVSGWTFLNWTADTDYVSLYGSSGDDTITGTGAGDQITGGGGMDTIHAGDGDDFLFIFPGDVVAGETYDGGAGTDYLRIDSAAADFADDTIISIEGLVLFNGSAVTFTSSQIGGGALDPALNIIGDTTHSESIVINMPSSGIVDLGGWTFSNWTADQDSITVNGSDGDDVVVGSSQNDVLIGGGGDDQLYGGPGKDTLTGGGGNDTFYYSDTGGPISIGPGGGAGGDPQTTITDFTSGSDHIDLTNVAGVHTFSDLSMAQNGADTVIDFGGGNTLSLLGIDQTTLSGGDFVFSPPPCYCRGTRILTDRGEVRVEDLAIGDQVITKSGTARPIKWIGRRSYGGRFALGNKDILPVCFKAGSLNDNVPRRDLWISPHHAMYLEGILIEAKDLLNGVSVIQAETIEQVEYFHIELDSHDVIVAEGALSESFIDDESRGMFHNAHEYCALYPDAPGAPARYCAPRRQEGYELEAARRHVDRRAGLAPAAGKSAVGGLRGYVDVVDARCIAGWAQMTGRPEAPVCLDIYAGGRLIGQTLANRYRADLQQAGLGSGNHSFEFTPHAGLDFAPNSVEVRCSLDGAVLASSMEMRCMPVQSAVRKVYRR